MTTRTGLATACTLIALSVVVSSGCISANVYQSPDKAASSTATISLHSSAVINQIDGKSARGESTLRELLVVVAGRHSLTIAYIGPEKGDSRTCKIEFEATAGSQYIIVPHIIGGTWAASLRVIDPTQSTKHATDRRMDPSIDIPCVF